MSITMNSRGEFFHHGLGGSFQINNGDPRTFIEDFDEEEARNLIEQAEEDFYERKGY